MPGEIPPLEPSMCAVSILIAKALRKIVYICELSAPYFCFWNPFFKKPTGEEKKGLPGIGHPLASVSLATYLVSVML